MFSLWKVPVLSFMYIYPDYQADGGDGAIRIKRFNPESIFVDPNTSLSNFSDAASIIYSDLHTKESLKILFPEKESLIENANPSEVNYMTGDISGTHTQKKDYPKEGESGDQDKEKGFDAGADDYLVKPFELRELKLRIEALHRRHAPQKPVLKAGDILFNPGTLEAEFHGLKAELSGTPARLFELLIREYPNFLSHQSLCDALWGTDDDFEGKSLRTHIYTLRKSLKDKLGHGMVKTVHGRGYRLEPPNAE